MSTVATWPSNAENWLDERGKGAWIAAMVLGFVVFWPVGLALLAYMIWSKRMFSNGCGRHGRHMRHTMGSHRRAFQSSGNSAFDAYKSDTLERLEREQQDFESFLERLRAAKDQSEFDDFMQERARAAKAGRGEDEAGKAAGKDTDVTVET